MQKEHNIFIAFLLFFTLFTYSDIFSQKGTKCKRHGFERVVLRGNRCVNEHIGSYPYGHYFLSPDTAIFMQEGIAVVVHGLMGDSSRQTCYNAILNTPGNKKEVWTPYGASFADNKLGYMMAFQYSLDPDTAAPKTGRGGIFRTRDTGKTWDLIESVTPPKVKLSDIKAVDSTEIYGLYNGDMVLTKDQGKTWTIFGKPTEVGVRAYNFCFLDPKDIKNIFVSGGGGIAKSTDGGKSWERKFEKSAGKLIFLNAKVGYALAGSNEYMYKTEDGGESWFESNLGLTMHGCKSHGFTDIFAADDSTAYGIGENMYMGCMLFEGKEGHQAFLGKTSDGGKSWKIFFKCSIYPDRLKDDPFFAMFVWASSGKDSTVYLYGRSSIWRSGRAGEPASLENNAAVQVAKFQVYPNPAMDSFIIESNLGIETNYQLKLVDITGKELINRQITTNQNKVSIDLSSFAPGIMGWYLSNQEGKVMHSGKIIKE